jgi:hypothetical protein
MRVLWIALLAGLMVPLAVRADTAQQTPGSQILITNCDPHRHTPAQAHPWIDPYGTTHTQNNFPSWDAFLTISYQNQASKAATEIGFGLVTRGSLVAVTKDLGTFSTGVSISHEFVVSSEIFPIGTTPPYCAVLWVKYADGSVWVNPHPPEQPVPSSISLKRT